jgi:hypothetical protein
MGDQVLATICLDIEFASHIWNLLVIFLNGSRQDEESGGVRGASL